jgi:hypothetical protein
MYFDLPMKLTGREEREKEVLERRIKLVGRSQTDEKW